MARCTRLDEIVWRAHTAYPWVKFKTFGFNDPNTLSIGTAYLRVVGRILRSRLLLYFASQGAWRMVWPLSPDFSAS